MAKTVISVEHLTKQYDLGLISSGTLARDLSRWWARVRGKEDPFTRVDNTNPFHNKPGESILALDDVSFKVEQGQALGIIGRNGAGKSTLLKILSRVTAPTSGVVKVKGRIGSLLEVGTGFHPELTGRENVFLNGAILGMRKSEVQRKFDEIVDFSGVEKFIDTPVKRYSSGMYVRLAFAVAAHLDPEILIVDEVLAVGDAEFQKKCLGKMSDVAGEGRTVLFVSHNMATIQNLCTECIYMENGKIVYSGNTKDVVNKYILETILSSQSIRHTAKYIKDVTLINDTGKVTDVIGTGSSLTIRMSFSMDDLSIRNPLIGIGINDLQGMRIFTLGTFLSNSELGLFEGNQVVDCKIDRVNLVPGEYSLKVAISDNSYKNLEEIDNFLTFRVEPADYYGNGKLPTKTQGIVLVDSNWSINE